MKIKDTKDKYILEIDIERKIVYEIPSGYWRGEDINRLHLDYVKKVVPLFNDKVWAKCVDLRTYKMSMITEEIKEHVIWAVNNGFKKGVMIVDEKDTYKSVIDLQMRQATDDSIVLPIPFTSKEDAFSWLKTQGF